mgnify:CR=1 FL=1
METKVDVLIIGIVMLLSGFTALLFLAPLHPTLVSFGALAFVVGINMTFIGFVEVATDKKSLQVSKRKIILLALSVVVIGLTVPYSVWAVITPNWAFSVTTDKSTYELGEPVQIKVTLKNLGFIEHSLTSGFKDLVIVSISNREFQNIWYNGRHIYDWIDTQFTVPAHQSLEKTFIWNQTNINFPEKEIEPGTYWIEASIPDSDAPTPLFYAYTTINITST